MITVVVIHNGQEQVHTFNGCRCDAQRFIREVVKNEMYDEIKISGKIETKTTEPKSIIIPRNIEQPQVISDIIIANPPTS